MALGIGNVSLYANAHLSCRLAEQAREAEKARREAAAKAKEYERTAKEELDLFKAKRAAAKKVWLLCCAAQHVRCGVLRRNVVCEAVMWCAVVS